MQLIDDAGKVWHRSKRTAVVKASFGGQVDGMRIFGCFVRAKVHPHSKAGERGDDLGSVSSPSRVGDAENANDRSLLRALQVLSVNARGCVSKVCQDIVRTISIDVVDGAVRPFPGYVKPCQSVSHVSIAVDVHASIPAGVTRPSRLSNSVAEFGKAPEKSSRARVIPNDFQETFMREVELLHGDKTLDLHTGSSVCA